MQIDSFIFENYVIPFIGAFVLWILVYLYQLEGMKLQDEVQIDELQRFGMWYHKRITTMQRSRIYSGIHYSLVPISLLGFWMIISPFFFSRVYVRGLIMIPIFFIFGVVFAIDRKYTT